MKTIVHYRDVPNAYAVRRSTVEYDEGPEPTPEQKRAELKAIAEAAERATQVLEEKPRRRRAE